MMEVKQDCDNVQLVIRDGQVCGCMQQTEFGSYYRFSGIPFAKPPVGCLRFLPPVPNQAWSGELDCTKEPPVCWTYPEGEEIIGSEDCLYINVCTKDLKPNKPLPVMFWISSIGYTFSLDSILNPSLLLNEDVIFVTCGFRVGPFGFLSLNDPGAPGNVGLKDIVMALKWVQNNITYFGGDPSNVTLFGSSSGGAIVHLMMLSTMATGLFHKTIIQNSSALNNWAVMKNPSTPIVELGKELQISSTYPFDIVEILKRLPAEEIMAGVLKMSKRRYLTKSEIFDGLFKPCIEDEFEGQPAFLTKQPSIIIKSGKFNKVPMIIGNNNIESTLLQFVKPETCDSFKEFNENSRLLVPKALGGETMSKIGMQILNFYIGEDETLRPETKKQYLQLISDYYFLYYINKSVIMHSQFTAECPVYYYILNYAGDWKVPEGLNFFNLTEFCAGLPYIFPLNTKEAKGSRDCRKVREKVVKMWTNFSKFGNPTPDDDDPLLQITWDPVQSKDRLSYLSIGTNLTKGRNPFYDRMAFWDKLHNDNTFMRALVYLHDLGVYWF